MHITSQNAYAEALEPPDAWTLPFAAPASAIEETLKAIHMEYDRRQHLSALSVQKLTDGMRAR